MAEPGVIRLFPAAGPPDPEAAETERMVEAVVFASAEPLAVEDIAGRLPEGRDVVAALEALCRLYAGRGVNLLRVAGKWAFRTAPDLAFLMAREMVDQKRLSKAALETLAIIAYHQPVTRAEIEDVRGVAVSRGTLDVLLETGWVRLRGRRRTPGRPVTFGVTEAFLDHFGLDTLADLPGVDELKAAGLLDSSLTGPASPVGSLRADLGRLADDEDPLDAGDAADHMDGRGADGSGEMP